MERRDFMKYLAAGSAAVILGCGRADKKAVSVTEAVNSLSPQPPAPLLGQGGALVLPEPTAQAISAVSRKQWHANEPLAGKMTTMNGCNRITIHHEGNPKPNNDGNPTAVAASLRGIQKAHCQSMDAGDIGYHFIIDRQGLIWQGRDLRYQGAHVKSNNSHNIGIMCLGNFELQQPTQAQLNALGKLSRALSKGYRIPPNQIFAHRELRSTACPGKNLYAYVQTIRDQIKRS
ncbi:hypothetical protein AGMMS49959_10350 [Planctomycetales bacterium]|nr:hypothetical protein AGMMS49959_10350 [Planctomycetales bacterium]